MFTHKGLGEEACEVVRTVELGSRGPLGAMGRKGMSIPE